MTEPKSYEDILKTVDQYRWPRKGDRLLRISGGDGAAAQFQRDGRVREVFIWSGYVRAGAALVDTCSREPFDGDYLIYPILFTYRQGLELAMKWIIDMYGGVVGVALSYGERNHDLFQLWKLCKKVILEVGSEGEDDEGLLAVERIVKEFHDMDKSGTTLRYAVNKQGLVPGLPAGPIELQNMKDVMEGVDNFFSGVDGQLDHNLSAAEY